ncbi:uncharacterized protein [Drosophila takahashii]|uniref:uncharacterized protein n=1 Tax=Drosophila takahashii TaxID=29030 RepID=UPI001CF8327B|nr:uncharacterized protein LOC123003018 [Drosophila takahashii]
MSKYFKKDIDFDVEQKRESMDRRTYGFMKTLRSDTPLPLAQKKIGSSTLLTKLKSWHETVVVNDESDSGSTKEPGPVFSIQPKSDRSNAMTFEMQRKLFDRAEFTITRGRKLSGHIHPTHSGVKLNFKDLEKQCLEDMEAYCRKMNIKFVK